MLHLASFSHVGMLINKLIKELKIIQKNKTIKIICVGKLKENYLNNAIKEYSLSIKKNIDFEIIEINDEKIPDNPSEKESSNIKKIEGIKILDKIKKNDFVINLNVDGKQINTIEFSKKIKSIDGNIAFIIGGSLGLSDDVLKRGNYSLSFSSMTFPHQLMRVILAEQINRIYS